jgi:hypothetical protein
MMVSHRREHSGTKRAEIWSWEELPSGGRQYWFEVAGRHGWKARYVKEVEANENTVRFWQEIYDEQDKLVEIHEKYPVDKGHQQV